jgi:hypothetical protein
MLKPAIRRFQSTGSLIQLAAKINQCVTAAKKAPAGDGPVGGSATPSRSVLERLLHILADGGRAVKDFWTSFQTRPDDRFWA